MEFKYLNFRYTEKPYPQQEDGWSCGAILVFIAERRMNGLSAGDWSDKVDIERLLCHIADLLSRSILSIPVIRRSKRTRHDVC